MKTLRLASAFPLWRALRAPVTAAAILTASMTLGACADENDPKTWVKRLDEQSQRALAIKTLDDKFNAAMSGAGNNREDPKVKGVVDDAIEALTKTYVTGGLDDKTRKDLMKLIADMGDPRSAPALSKAFRDYEPGKNDEDVLYAAQGTSRLSAAGKLTDQGLIDALWDGFVKLKPTQTKSSQLFQDMQSAVKTVKHPSWGPKAVALLAVPVDPSKKEDVIDQLDYAQLTAVQLIGETKFTAGIPPLVKVLLTPTKKKLATATRLALHRMYKEAEPELIKALKGEGDYAKLAESYPEKAHMPLVAEPLAYISRPAGLAAILDALGTATTDQNRVALGSYLTFFPHEPRLVKAFTDAYAKVSPNAAIAMMNGGNGHAIMTGASANFYEPSMTDWILREVAAAKGEAADSIHASALPAAIKLMTPEQSKAVGDAVAKIPGQAIEKDMFKSANAVVEKCKKDSACYLSALETPVPSSPPAAKTGHVKAIWESVILKGAGTKAKFLDRIEKERDPSIRLALLEGVDALSPQGDTAAADRLDKLVTAETKSPNASTDEMSRIALKLRSRVP